MGKGKVVAGLLLLVFGLLLIFAFLSITGRSTGNFSQAFLQGHSERVESDKVFFSFRLENHEGEPMEYVYRVFFDGGKVFEKNRFVENGYFVEAAETITVETGFSGKKKVVVEISSPTKPVGLSLFFWVYS